MNKKTLKTVFQLAGVIALVAVFAGCGTITQYSVESYQGLMPADDLPLAYSPE